MSTSIPRRGRRSTTQNSTLFLSLCLTWGCGEPTDAETGDDTAATGGMSQASGGMQNASGGGSASGGTPSASTGGSANAGGDGAGGGDVEGSGGANAASGGSSAGGSAAGGSAAGGSAAGGSESSDGGSGGAMGSGGAFSGTCTASEPAGRNVSGTGPHNVVAEINSDPGINEGTIYRPEDLGGDEKYPILVWGEGGCSRDGFSNATAMAEIASYGYFVVADGTPGGSGNRTMDRNDLAGMGAPLIAYVDWVLSENEKPCSAYYQSVLPTKISANGFSCGGLMAQGTVTDPRIVTWGVTSSGMAGATQAFYDLIDTPVLFVEGGPDEVAYDGGLDGYQKISQLGVPVLWFSKNIGHGGDLFTPDGGDFTKINLAWLNWWLKDDETATGKGLLVGSSCPYCSDSEWEVMSANVP